MFCTADFFRQTTGFLGQLEDFKKGNTLIVKLHGCNEKFSSAILLIRNPYDLLITEYSRRHTSNHTGYFPRQNMTGEDWEDFVNMTTSKWESSVTCWLNNTTPVLVVHYEDLMNDMMSGIDRMLSFLNLKFTVDRRRCIAQNNEGNFHRKPPQDSEERMFDPYTPVLRALIDEHIRNINLMLTEHGHRSIQPAFKV
ncbi:sialate:O-sulfotransferase 1-like [Glandiceps talaboti]